MLDFSIIFFFFFAWVLSYYYSTTKTMDLIDNSEYLDFANKGRWYAETYTMDSIAILFIMIKIVWVFRISRFIHWALLTVDKVSILMA